MERASHLRALTTWPAVRNDFDGLLLIGSRQDLPAASSGPPEGILSYTVCAQHRYVVMMRFDSRHLRLLPFHLFTLTPRGAQAWTGACVLAVTRPAGAMGGGSVAGCANQRQRTRPSRHRPRQATTSPTPPSQPTWPTLATKVGPVPLLRRLRFLLNLARMLHTCACRILLLFARPRVMHGLKNVLMSHQRAFSNASQRTM